MSFANGLSSGSTCITIFSFLKFLEFPHLSSIKYFYFRFPLLTTSMSQIVIFIDFNLRSCCIDTRQGYQISCWFFHIQKLILLWSWSQFMMLILSIVGQLLSNLMGYFNCKFSIQIEFLYQRECEILRRVLRVIDIPFKTIFQTDIVNFDIQLKNLQAFLLFRPMNSMMTDSFFYSIDNLCLERSKQSILRQK